MNTKTRERLQGLLVWAWFILLAVVFMRPLFAHCAAEVAGEIGDNIYFIWMIGWVKKALFTLHVNPLDVWFLNYPEGWDMARTEITPAQLALAQPFTFLGSEVFAYNMTMFVSFVLSGVITYGWVKHMSGSRAAGILSGTIFACLPYRQAHFLIGHLNLSGTQWLPLFFWGWFDLMAPGTGEVRRKAALKAALGLGLTALTSQYYFFMMVIVAGFQAAWMVFVHQREKLKDPAFWRSCAAFVLYSLPLLLAAELPFLRLNGAGGMPDRDWGSVRMYSAGLSDYLLPSTTHFLFGNWVGAHFDRSIWIEATLYVGIAALGLFLCAMIRRKDIRPERQMLLAGVVIAVVLSMGTDLHWNASPVELTLPAFLAQKLGRETLPILLPGFFFFKYFPFFAKLRAMMRFGIFAELLIAAGAGYAVCGKQVRGKRRVCLTAAACALVIFDFFPKPVANFSEVGPRQADLWIAEQPETGSVMRYPFFLNDDQAGTYYSLYQEKPFIGGFFNAFPTEQYQRIKDLMNGWPSEASVAEAKALDVSFFLVEREETEKAIADGTIPWGSVDELSAAAERLGLVLAGSFDGIDVWQFAN